MNGAFPPNSIETFLTVSADWRINNLPTLVEPVKVTLRNSGRAIIAPPMAGASPVTMLITPLG